MPSVLRFTVGAALAALVSTGAAAREFPEPYNTEKPGLAPISAAEAAASFTLPEGFKVSVFAAEPDVQQPITMTTDPRGRLWVVENYTYAEAKAGFATNLNDRILIFTDTNHDGRFDKRTVFWDQGKLVTSVEPGLGGVFVMAPPQLLFIPDRNGDDIPDGEPQVLLDGFNTTTGSRHTFANGLKWGPDGWLWGRVGISSTARAGVPGAPDRDRVLMAGGIWRYHPQRHVVEAVAQGTTNPWGLDWNEVGEPFFINTVIGHLWHAIPGAHFKRMYGDDPDPHSYGLIDQHADHYHFDTGAGWTKSRAALDGSSFAAGSDSLGGGHAHSGLMIYLGENWPERYRGELFTLNYHGSRVNEERLERLGSGYVGKHEPDLLSVGDPWFRGIELLYGPDGGVFVADWSDTGECHDQDGIHRTSGRIYKVTYGDPKPPKEADLTKLASAELLPRLFDRNEWVARQARRVLADRNAQGNDSKALRNALLAGYEGQPTVVGKLQTIWALIGIGGVTPDWLLAQTQDANEYVRSWAVRLLVDDPAPLQPAVLQRLVEMGRSDPSAFVRLYLASALQHLSLDARRELAGVLVRHPEDVGDHNLGNMVWYGIEPLVEAQPKAAVELALASEFPVIRRNVARWFAENVETSPAPLSLLLERSGEASPAHQAEIILGMSEALQGWRKAPPPANWTAFATRAAISSDPAERDRVRDLNILFGDGRALDDLRGVVVDANVPAATRVAALKTLLDNRATNLVSLLQQFANDPVLRTPAMVGLLQLGDPEAPGLATARYPWVAVEDRPALLAALVTRPAAARALVEAVAEGKIPRTELTPFVARQIASLNDPALTQRLTDAWGAVRAPDADKRAGIERFRAQFTADRLKSANLAHGRQVFAQLCASCHQLYGEGGQVGPDLTGSGRANLDYLLENIVDPSAVVPVEYRMVIVTLKDGRVLNGVLREQTTRTVTVQSQAERAAFERSELVSLEPSNQSMMPEGMLEALKPDEACDLVAYLMHPRQVPVTTAAK